VKKLKFKFRTGTDSSRQACYFLHLNGAPVCMCLPVRTHTLGTAWQKATEYVKERIKEYGADNVKFEAYLRWKELSAEQQAAVVAKLGKISKEEGAAYLQKGGMQYQIGVHGEFMGGYIDPYLLSNIF